MATLEERLRLVELRSEQLLEVRVWREKVLLAVCAFLLGALLTGIGAGVPHSHRLAILEERQQGIMRQLHHMGQYVPRPPLGGEAPL